MVLSQANPERDSIVQHLPTVHAQDLISAQNQTIQKQEKAYSLYGYCSKFPTCILWISQSLLVGPFI